MSKRSAETGLEPNETYKDTPPAADVKRAAPEIRAKRSILRVRRGPAIPESSLSADDDEQPQASTTTEKTSPEETADADSAGIETNGRSASDLAVSHEESSSVKEQVTEDNSGEAAAENVQQPANNRPTSGASGDSATQQTGDSATQQTDDTDGTTVLPTELTPEAVNSVEKVEERQPEASCPSEETSENAENTSDDHKGSASCLPSPSTLTNTDKYDNPFLRHASIATGAGLFGVARAGATDSSKTEDTGSASQGSTKTAGLFTSVGNGGLFSNSLFGGLSVPGGASTKTGLFSNAPLGCGLFGTMSRSGTDTALSKDAEEEECTQEDEFQPLTTMPNEDEENVFEDASCRFSKMIQKDENAGKSGCEWISSINGKAEITKHKTASKSFPRILFRQNGSGRLLLNTDIFDDAGYNAFKAKSVIFNGRQIDDESRLIPCRLTFTTTETRSKFLDAIRDMQQVIKESKTTSPDSLCTQNDGETAENAEEQAESASSESM